MVELMIAFLLGLACPGYTTNNSTNNSTNDSTHDNVKMMGEQPVDTGGEGTHIPPKFP
ncbi:hypothetical protein H7F33_10425 [Pedobacter sp. PAMC26386]|nr:hypothetical protein H7F33_10425 [Pedobacter sp. PAMC26386]